MGMEKATVKGHTLAVGDQVNFHGMVTGSFPATDPTLCVLGKAGNKYTLTSVNDMDSTGKPWVWTFGAAAAFWASPVEKVEVPKASINPWGECGPCDGTDAPMARKAHPCGLMPKVEEPAPVVYTALNPAPYGEHKGHRMNLSGTHRGNRVCLDCGVIPVGIPTVEVPAMDEFSIPTNTPDIAGYHWQRYVLPGDSVTALSTYQLVQVGTTCQVVATVKYVKDGMWQATGCAWMATSLTEGYWRGESLSAAFAHVVQYMTWVASLRGSGLTWADVNGLDWRTPYVAPEVVGGERAAVAAGDWVAYTDQATRVAERAMVKPMSKATADVLMPRTERKTATVTTVRTPKLAPRIQAKLNKRARKAAKRHAFAGKR